MTQPLPKSRYPIPDRVKELMCRLSTKMTSAYLVGGAVRDYVMGRVPTDFDIVCFLSEDEIRDALKDGFADKSTSINKKGTIEGRGDTIYQVTPVNEHGLEEDLRGRDFRINAMAMDTEGIITDPFGGLNDIKDRSMRCVDDDRCFGESPIRLIRAFRFMSQLGFTFKHSMAESIMDHAHLIFGAPPEMLFNEMTRVLNGPVVGRTLTRMANLNIFKYLFPEFAGAENVQQSMPWHDKTVWGHTVSAVCHVKADPLLKWAALLHDIGKPCCQSRGPDGFHFYKHDLVGAKITQQVCERFRMPNSVTKDLILLVENHLRIVMYDDSWSDAAVLRIDRELGEKYTEMLYDLALADVSAGAASRVSEGRSKLFEFRTRLDKLRLERGEVKTLLPSGVGERIMTVLAIQPGKEVGLVKSRLEEEIKQGNLLENQSVEYYDQAIRQLGVHSGRRDHTSGGEGSSL